jgi:hypothetical protein
MTELTRINPAAIFCRSLAQLSAMLDKTGTAPQLLAARLHPDMLPFAQQVRAAVSFSLRGCCRLAGLEVADFSAAASLQEQIAQTIRYLKAIPAERFDGPLERLCRDRRLCRHRAAGRRILEFIYSAEFLLSLRHGVRDRPQRRRGHRQGRFRRLSCVCAGFQL